MHRRADHRPERSSERSVQARRGDPTTLRLAVEAPFHLEATVRVLQRRPGNLVDRWEERCYRRVIRVRGRPVLVEVRDFGDVDAPKLELRVRGGRASRRRTAEAARVVRDILGLDFDPARSRSRAEAVPALRETARALRGMRPPRFPDFFETFANVIPFQQVSLAAGMAVVSALVRRFGDELSVDGRPYAVFPAARTIARARTRSLRACGMSTRKAHALRAIARAIDSGTLAAERLYPLVSADAIEELECLPGIGSWSAALVLLRGLRRLDVFPQADTGAEGSLARLLHLRSRASLARVVERFGDCRGYLYFYGLASRLLAAGLIHPAAPAR